MKSIAPSPLALALAALAIALPAGAQDNDIVLELEKKPAKARRESLAERRLPAMTRIYLGLTPYVYAGRPLVRHDEVASNVLSVHLVNIDGKTELRAGHSLAPNLHRIANP